MTILRDLLQTIAAGLLLILALLCVGICLGVVKVGYCLVAGCLY